MFSEIRIQFTSKFVQQSVTLGKVVTSIGDTPTKLKNKINKKLTDVHSNGTPILRVIESNYNSFSAAPKEITSPIEEKEMTLVGNLKLRYRKYNGNLSDNKSIATVRTILQKLHAVVPDCYGTIDVFGYIPLDRSTSSHNRYNRWLVNSDWEHLLPFFRGQDIPSTVFSPVYSATFSDKRFSCLPAAGSTDMDTGYDLQVNRYVRTARNAGPSVLYMINSVGIRPSSFAFILNHYDPATMYTTEPEENNASTEPDTSELDATDLEIMDGALRDFHDDFEDSDEEDYYDSDERI